MSSPDGITWTDITPTTPLDGQAVIASDDVGLVTVLTSDPTDGDSVAMFSTDGETWENVSLTNQTIHFYSAAYAPALGRLVALSLSATADSVETYDVAGSNWRVGTIRLGVVEGGRR